MLDLVPLVTRLVPGLLDHSTHSVACICTTRPKYLVFNGDPAKPVCVVEFGTAERLARINGILSELHHRIPHVVPRAIYYAPCDNGSYVLIQEGRAGVPWFRVSDGLVSAADWRLLLGRAVQVMLGLRSATRATPAWTGTIDVGAELERQAALCEANGMTLSEPVRARVSEWARRIAGDGPVQTAWQHGDFSLNNLLVTNDSIAIIDFDEFGETLVPLHDAFGLALSVRLSQAGCPLSLPECIRLAVAPAMIDEAVTAAQLPALLMHHLLWRLNQCVGLERRASLARTMLAWTHEFACDPRQFIGASYLSHPG